MDPAVPATGSTVPPTTPAPVTPPPAPPLPTTPATAVPPPPAETPLPGPNKWLLIGGAIALVFIVLAGATVYFVMTQPKTQTPPPAVPTTPKTTVQPAVPTTPALTQPVNQIPLTIGSPLNNTVVRMPNLRVTGTTSPNADVSVNETDTKADATGKFSATITLSEGDNPIIITAMDQNGSASEEEITVIYEPTQ